MRPRREKKKTTGILMLVRYIVQPQDRILLPTCAYMHARTHTHKKKFEKNMNRNMMELNELIIYVIHYALYIPIIKCLL